MSSLNFVQALMLLGAFQGIVLVFVLTGAKHRQIPSNKVLAPFVGAISFLLLLVSFTKVEIVPVDSGLGYLGDSVGLLYGPLFYFYILRLLTPSKHKLAPHLIPFSIFLGICTLAIFLPGAVESDWYSTFYTIMNSTSLVQLGIYLTLSFIIIRQYGLQAKRELSFHATFRYLVVLIIITASCLLIFSINYAFQLLGYQIPFRFMGYELGWVLLSGVTLTLAYFAMRQPEIFRLETRRQSQNGTVASEDLRGVLDRLQDCLENEKPYLNPDLTLEVLAKQVGYRKELLSKAINSGLDMNFYRLINEHRIREFEVLAKDPANAHLTHLALALDAGFRSKTTFYKAFRELKQSTPAAYLKSL